jgi:hypothetical protein
LKTISFPLIALCSLSLLTFSACLSDPDLAFRSDIIGRWRISDYTTSGTETLLNNNGTNRVRQVTTTVTNNDLEVTFSDNPASYYSIGTYTINYSFIEDGETTSLSTIATGIGQGSWTFDNGRLEMVSHQGAEIYHLEQVIKNGDESLEASGSYELLQISNDQPKTAELSVAFSLTPL